MKLSGEHTTTEVAIQQLAGGGRLRAKQNMKKLIITEEFLAGNRTLESFLSSISFCVVSFDY